MQTKGPIMLPGKAAAKLPCVFTVAGSKIVSKSLPEESMGAEVARNSKLSEGEDFPPLTPMGRT